MSVIARRNDSVCRWSPFKKWSGRTFHRRNQHLYSHQHAYDHQRVSIDNEMTTPTEYLAGFMTRNHDAHRLFSTPMLPFSQH